MMKRDVYRRAIREDRDFVSEWQEEAKDAYEMRAGRQWTEEELTFLDLNKRPAITFNRLSPIIESIRGHHINNRQELRYFPRKAATQGIADTINAAAEWADDLCHAPFHIADAFTDMYTCGMGWTEMRMDYLVDPAGRIITAERFSPLEVIWDCNSTAQNLTDARRITRTRWLPRDEALARWPKSEDFLYGIDGVTSSSFSETINRGSVVKDYPTSNISFYRKATDEVLVYQTQYSEIEYVYLIRDPVSQQVIEVSEPRFEMLKDRLSKLGLNAVKVPRRRFYQIFAVQDEILEHTKAPDPNGFTLHCMTGIRDENKNFWYGIVRILKDPVRWANKFLSDFQDYIASNRRGGAFVEEDAFVDPRRAEEYWNNPSGMIIVASGALTNGKIQERQPPTFPSGMDRLLQFAIQAIPDVGGVNLETLGLVDRNQPGVLEQQRKQATLTILAGMFNALQLYQEYRGYTLAYFIQNYISDGRLIRIQGADGTSEKFVPLVKGEEVVSFDVKVDTAPTAPDIKGRVFAVLTSLVPYLDKMGIRPPMEIFDYLPLPASLAEKWKTSALAPEEEGQQGPDPALFKAQVEMQKAQGQQQLDSLRIENERARIMLTKEQIEQTRAKDEMENRIAQAELQLKKAELQQREQVESLNRVENSIREFRETVMDMVKVMTDKDDKERDREVQRATNAQKRTKSPD